MKPVGTAGSRRPADRGRARRWLTPTGDPARDAACDALLAVDVEGAYLNLLLPKLLTQRALGTRDAAFATELAYGAARRSGVLLAVIEAAGGRSPADLDPPIRTVLTLGAYQILHTRVPARAAVATSVDAVRRLAGPRPAGLVNAVMRRVAETDWPGWVDRLAPVAPLGRLAFAAGYPEWIAAAFADALGVDPANDPDPLRRALADAPPPVHLVARPGRIDRDDLLADAGPAATAGLLSPYAVILGGGDPGLIPAVASGAAAVQDEGSQLVATAPTVPEVHPGDAGRWLDCCAGPGGKAALLQSLLPTGGRLIAADSSTHRAQLTAGALLPRSATVIAADGRQPAWRSTSFDRVLLDAPCTGLGSLRRRPEARWRKTPADVAELAGLQRALLHRAADSVRAGGVIAYATCSPHLDETRAVVDSVLGARPELSRIDAWSAMPAGVGTSRPGTSGAADPRDVQLWPHLHGTDAMFLALIRRDSQ